MKNLISSKIIGKKIFIIRSQKVMVDIDLAQMYGIKTKVLNQAVKRNIKRFPSDFMFRLTVNEKDEVVTNCDHLNKLKFTKNTPYVFTEQGVAMLSSVLKSDRAIQVNVVIMRAFVKLREILLTNKRLAEKLNQLENKVEKNDEEIRIIFEAIHQLMEHPENPKKKIGFVK